MERFVGGCSGLVSWVWLIYILLHSMLGIATSGKNPPYNDVVIKFFIFNCLFEPFSKPLASPCEGSCPKQSLGFETF
jgi:hypothetical protein